MGSFGGKSALLSSQVLVRLVVDISMIYVTSWWFFTNPFEKYAHPSNWINLPPIFEVKISKIFELPPPSVYHLDI